MKVRIKFSKYGALKFIGHLDVMRYFQKAIRRADIDIAYSGGFSPHQIMSFAAPLSVGSTSQGEYFDLEIVSFPGEEELKQQLQKTMVEGIDILAVKALKEGERNAMASVAAASYLVSFREESRLPRGWQDKLMDFYSLESIPVEKMTKKKVRMVDLKENIYELQIRRGTPKKGETYVPKEEVYLLLNASSGENMKPDFVLNTFFDSLHFEPGPWFLRIHRLDTLQDLGQDGIRKLVPLIWEK